MYFSVCAFGSYFVPGRLVWYLFLSVLIFCILACGSEGKLETNLESQANSKGETGSDLVEGTNMAKPNNPGVAHEIKFTVSAAGFSGPESTSSGWNRIILHNQGTIDHHLGILKLVENKTVADLRELIEGKPDVMIPSWVLPLGGPADVSPGLTSTVTLNLQEGDYALTAYVKDHNQIARLGTSMLMPLTVIASESVGEAPTHDVVLSISDYSFVVSNTRDRFGINSGKAIDSGPRIIKITNEGNHIHEARIVELEPNKQARDYPDLYFMQKDTQGGFGGAGRFLPVPVINEDGSGPGGPPPGKAIGGTLAILPGGTIYVTATLTPSWHFVYDILEDVEFGAPHLLRPMLLQFPVR